MFFTFKLVIILLLNCSLVLAKNSTISSFSQAKKYLKTIYKDHRETFYCQAKFLEDGTIILPEGFVTPKYKKRSKKIEWEHVVPAENFGRSFIEWREGHSKCIDNKGNFFKGRHCAEKINEEYRFMQADMYNLYPAIGSVNAMRSNFNFTELPNDIPNTFGTCLMKIKNKKVEPPFYTKGVIARTYFYMEQEYSRFKINSSMKKILMVWDNKYPVTQWECLRAQRIENIQGNVNDIVKKRCEDKGFL